VIREGTHCFDPFNPNVPPATCPNTGLGGEPLLEPIVDYSHAEGGLSAIGGYIYRGERSAALAGSYLFGDFSAAFGAPLGRLYFLPHTNGGAGIEEFRIGPEDRPYGRFLKGFGEDKDGEVYALSSTALGPIGTTGTVERIVALPQPALDVRPGGCPNPLNPRANGKLPVALLGTAGFDVGRVDPSTLVLERADGTGGTVTPVKFGIEDTGTPFEGEQCECHEAQGDGIPDLNMRFDVQAVVAALGLSAFTPETVPVRVSGRLNPQTGTGKSIYRFSMDGAQEPGGTGSAGTGECTVILIESSGSVSVSCTYQGLTGTANNAHIHGLSPPGVNSGVIVPLTQTGGTSGSITGGGVLSPELVQGMLDGLTYVNLHSTFKPGGEIRGQIVGGEPFSAEDCLVSLSTGPPLGVPGLRLDPMPSTVMPAP
jgi:hypothetical protein